jgi:hypothetical protein
MVDFDTAKCDPASVFATPEAVLQSTEFDREQKIEILRSWAYDAKEMAVADQENMSGGENDLMERILAALHQLDNFEGDPF